MLEHFFDNPVAVERLRSESLGPYLDSFAASLARLGYARCTAESQFGLLAKMGRWLACHELTVADLEERITNRFLDEEGRRRRGDRATLRRFLDHLRREGVIAVPERVPEEQPLARLESQYEQYLRVERGLCAITVHNYLPLRGAHLLRHSLATGMLRGGASMTEIGQILRHRAATTTEIHAKVDCEGLRALAQRWPGQEVQR